MFRQTKAYEMKVPEGCAELTRDEMEYDGGWPTFVAGILCTVISVACTAAGYNDAATVFALAGAVLTLGSVAITINAGVKVAQGVATVAQEATFGKGIATGIIDLGVNLCGTGASYGLSKKG
ncbi:MAG: hypothetical protein LBG62_05645 [Candidatus Methanoplasma sp.]|jgi:hypothetical protein|nr:hypothetical protein [Candidatus Methanoplasma sp.]